ncbi:GntR family transcriptional regulator [Niveispirillum lacus]|uniref:GntR family transcriptional regulator n=1 Tax=Niveispirillum lacus TaxID=1981099 RepID=A0A255YZ68_9PROT|nr:GntR family transcriptional regulator [Niveispirillum lacus]OYQ34502.1 GntR family transcriptional regulator [Niveispirillum lacus]
MSYNKDAAQTVRALAGIRDLILRGEVEPGERLSEPGLAEKLGISRTPIRAALARLEQEGLLERVPAGGHIPRRFTLDEAIDAIELRGVLEGTAARLAAERGVEPRRMMAIHRVLDAIDAVIALNPAAPPLDRYTALNAEFHTLLSGLSGSDTIEREIDRLTRLPFASPSAFLDKPGLPVVPHSLILAQSQHRTLVEAISLREGARAEAVAREHARLARRNLEQVMEGGHAALRRFPALALVAG